MHSFRLCFAVFAAAILVGAAARAADLTGVYENTGSLASSPTPEPAGTVSFQGLLQLNFDYALTRAQHSATNRVVIREAATHFTIRCLDPDDRETWSGRWEKGNGCAITEEGVELTFHNTQLKYDSYVFTLQPVPNRDLLLVEVKRINATTLGPSVQPVGTFLFGRIAKR